MIAPCLTMPALALLALLAGSAPGHAAPALDDAVAFIPDSNGAVSPRQLLVMLRLPAPHYRPDASYGGRYIDDGGRSARHRITEDLARRHGLKLVADWPMPALGLDCYLLEYGEGEQPQHLADLLSRDPRVEWAQPVGLFSGMGDADPLYPVQPGGRYWHVDALHRTATGRDVAVAVVDSGIDSRHPDLAGQVALTENFVDGRPYAAEAHGTAVAGIIAARDGNGGMLGVAPGARLMGLRACWQQLDHSTRCNSFTLGKALNFAIVHRAKIINLSLSGPSDRLLESLLDAALARGISIVGALDPHGGGRAFPASHAGVIAVAQQEHASPVAARPDGPQHGVRLAPGRDIPTSIPGGGWRFVSGNSYAAAHVTGLLALLAELRPGAMPAQLEGLLMPEMRLNATIDACATIARAAGACPCSCATASAILPVDPGP